MLLPTHATSPQNPTFFNAYLTPFDSHATLTQQAQPFTSSETRPTTLKPMTTFNANHHITRRHSIYKPPNVLRNNIPTTFVTVTTTLPAVTTQWVTVPAMSSAVAVADGLAATTMTQDVSKAQLGQPAEGDVTDWPPLLTIFLLCWVIVAWAVAIVLFFATFPEKVGWLDGVVVRLRGGRRYRNKHRDRDRHPNKPTGDLRPSGQDTAAQATGLGISFDGEPGTPRLHRPRSFDSEAFESNDPRPMYGFIAATAPLPSSRSFTALSPVGSPTNNDTDREYYSADLETGVRGEDGSGRQQPVAGGIAGVLESINAVIDFVARNLAEMTSDQVVDGAERVLLVPVREEEREPTVGVV